MKLNKTQKLWKKAKKIIPGGNMLLSKRPDLYLPNKWPAYYAKTKGCEIWDLDNKKYFDLSLMGVGTNILGYSHPAIDREVKRIVKLGNLSTLNCKEEVYLAEKLIEMHSWSDMVKFARTGGEANAIAIRIARAASGKDNVAFCGYHGWHDWYLATNLRNKRNLNHHLLKGISTNGVPRNLKNSIFPFKYNDYKSLENLVERKKIGTICMEVMRNEYPQNNFLQKVRDLSKKKGIILVFDECTSGFRKNFGGLHLHFNIIPDIAIFGKALGNGYAITAIVGKKDIMKAADGSFISSTFWTERIGSAAALATLNEMEKIKSWKIIDNNGNYIIKNWQIIANRHNIQIDIKGLPSLCNFSIKSKNSDKYKTLITQELLKHRFLSSNTIYSSVAHTKSILDRYFDQLDKIFKLIQKCENGLNIDKLLENNIPRKGFERLN